MRMEKREAYFILVLAVVGLVTAFGCRIEKDCDCGCKGNCGTACQCVEYGDLLDRQAEVSQNLNALFTTEVAYFGENNTFTNRFSNLAWSPFPESRYAYFLPGDSIQPSLTGAYHLVPGIFPAVDEYSFTVVAVGNLDCDDAFDVWTINDQKQLINWINDINQ